jgi:hypothetical protein
MKKLFTLLLFFTSSVLLSAQTETTISGMVQDNKGELIPMANIYIKNSFDGTNSKLDGSFTFRTSENGLKTLIVSFIGFKAFEKQVELKGGTLLVEVILVEEINKIDGVTITAGAFEASDIKKVTVLKPLDIVTTASAAGDITGAINTLPGTATVGESGRLFVRGGEGYETKVFIDGLEVRNAFGATAPNVPTRGRFSPFLFKGTVFSTGGYSAEYGQALSSALVLNSNDIAEKTQGDVSVMSVGGDLAYTKKWTNTSVSGKIQYSDLRPYNDMINQFFDWETAPTSTVAEFVVRQKVNKNGLLKLYTNLSVSSLTIRQPDINRAGAKDTVSIGNDYFYFNASYKDILSKKLSVRGGLSATINKDKIGFNGDKFNENENGAHAKVAFNWEAAEKVSVNFGTEVLAKTYTRALFADQANETTFDFSENIISTYAETDYFASNSFVVRAGLRMETSSLLNRSWLSPRLAMSYKLNEKGQFSFAYGEFLQSAQNNYALVNQQLLPEKAEHLMLNYQYVHENRVFRVETYLKDYDNLVKFTDPNDFTTANYTNTGFGEAKGVDVFWRDGKTFEKTDYWISYSYVDSERDYQDFSSLATPSFVSNHNFSFVVKHFVKPLRTQFGATYNFASNRPFHNPNKQGFQNDKTPEFHDLSLNAAILIKQNIIIYVSSSNIFGRDNIFGYQFANQPNSEGIFESEAVRQGAKRFIFLGIFITLTKDGKENQLDNL